MGADKPGTLGWGGIVIRNQDQDLQEQEPFRWVFGGTGAEAPRGGLTALSYEWQRVSKAGEKGVSMIGQEVKGRPPVLRGQAARLQSLEH